jgi:Tol biopolymer transport system component
MRFHVRSCWRAALVSSAAVLLSLAIVNALELVSVSDPAVAPPAGGGGDSVAPILSPDARFVLFSSTAQNLCPNASNAPIRAPFPPCMNVFLRNRTNNRTQLVSMNFPGTGGGNGDSFPAGISTNGQFVLFESRAGDLVGQDTNGCNDLFIRDLFAGTTALVSLGTNGANANGESRDAVMSLDGRYVAFVSDASNLVPGDTNRIPDVFVRDLQSNTTLAVSQGAMATNVARGGGSEGPGMTPDGRYVVFYSSATNLVAGVQTTGDIYVRDLTAATTVCCTTNARSQLYAIMGTSNAVFGNYALSEDGHYVAYLASPGVSIQSVAILLRHDLTTGSTDVVSTNANVSSVGAPSDSRDLDMTPDGRLIAFVANVLGTPGVSTCICVWDGQTGETAVASGDLSNSVPPDSICAYPTIDSSGRLVAFVSLNTNLTTNTLAGDCHLYVRNLQTDTTRLVNANQEGQGCSVSFLSPSQFTANGRFIAFQAPDGNLVPGDRNHHKDVFLRDLSADAAQLISAREPAMPSLSPAGGGGSSSWSVSSDGRFVAFATDADNVVPADTNGRRDVFVRDLVGGTNILVSVNASGLGAGNEHSMDPSISGDGRFVAFSSSANDLVAGDTNKECDVFVRDLLAKATTLVSVNTNGNGPGIKASGAPRISADGRRILFRSFAYNLAPGARYPYENLFFRDLDSGMTRALTTAGVNSESITPDGRLVAFVGTVTGSTPYLYVWDAQSGTLVHTNTTAALSKAAISPDGTRLAYATASQLYAADWQANTNWLVGDMTPSAHSGMRFSADGGFLTYASTNAQATVDTNRTYDVYLYDLHTRSKVLVSHGLGVTGAADGSSDCPDISADGRFVAYRSTANNLVSGDTNGIGDVFIYDAPSDATTLLSVSRFGAFSGNNWCFAPAFTSDGRYILFQSWSSDLVGFDFNQGNDVFAHAMFYAVITSGELPTRGPTLSWPTAIGKTYHVEFLEAMRGTNWQEADGTVAVVGERAYFTDLAPASIQRFYRVVAR